MTAELFDALVDDAGLFPPEELAMPAALARYRHDRAGCGPRRGEHVGRAATEPMLSGRFLCPAGALDDLVAALAPGDEVEVGLISALTEPTVRAARERITSQLRLRLASVEGTVVGSVADAVRALRDLSVPRYVELPVLGAEPALDLLAATGIGAKVRCGGLRAELFPTPAQLGAFLVACVARGVPLKATAGLHHAVRHRDPATGFTHHGFLNLVLAVARAVAGADLAGVVEVLRSEDSAALAAEAGRVDGAHARRTRAAFVCYGSCSTSEPPADLRALGLFAGAAAR